MSCFHACIEGTAVRRLLTSNLWRTATPSGQLSDSSYLRLSRAGLKCDPPSTCESAGVSQSSVGSARVTAGADSGCTRDAGRYFSVMWCKASKKKHKRWEGDAVLITRGRTATLKDMEGKDIGKGEKT